MPEAGIGCVPSAGQADLPGPEKASRSLDALLTQIPCPAAYSTTCLLSYCGARLWLTCGSSTCSDEPEGTVLRAEIIKWYILVTDCAAVRMHAGKRQRQPPSVPLSPQRASPYSVHRSIFLDFPYLRFGWLIFLIPVP